MWYMLYFFETFQKFCIFILKGWKGFFFLGVFLLIFALVF